MRFEIIHLPRSHPDQKVWKSLMERLKSFRLQSLLLSPEAFSSTYAVESGFSDGIWLSRMANPLATHVVAVSTNDGLNSETGDSLERAVFRTWFGSAVLIGPLESEVAAESTSDPPKDSTHVPSDEKKKPGGSSQLRIVYQLNGVYVLPDARGSGVGRAMIDAMLQQGRAIERARSGDVVIFQVKVHPENFSAQILYEKAGFRPLGTETVALKEMQKGIMNMPAEEATMIIMERVEKLYALDEEVKSMN